MSTAHKDTIVVDVAMFLVAAFAIAAFAYSLLTKGDRP